MAKKKKKGFSGSKQTKNAVGEINVTPLIDIVLVLLIIYMVVTPVMIHQMQSKLPEKTDEVEPDDVPKEQILVAACEDGTYTLNRRVYEVPRLIDGIRKKVVRKMNKGEQGMVFLDAHPDVEYDQVIQLMDAINEAGNQIEFKIKIGLASLKSTEEFSACTPIKG